MFPIRYITLRYTQIISYIFLSVTKRLSLILQKLTKSDIFSVYFYLFYPLFYYFLYIFNIYLIISFFCVPSVSPFKKSKKSSKPTVYHLFILRVETRKPEQIYIKNYLIIDLHISKP